MSVVKTLASLSAQLEYFSLEFSRRVSEVEELMTTKPHTSPAHYRRHLEELNNRLILAAGDIKALETSTLDVFSTSELVMLAEKLFEHCSVVVSKVDSQIQQSTFNIDSKSDLQESSKSSVPGSSPSSASPPLMSPSLQALLGKYATFSEGEDPSPTLIKSEVSLACQNPLGDQHRSSCYPPFLKEVPVNHSVDEESTIELKAQVISSRGLDGHGIESLQDAIDAALKRSTLSPSLASSVRLVGPGEYSSLPSFIKAQMPFEILNSTLDYIYGLLEKRAKQDGQSNQTFSLDDVLTVLGNPSQAKVFVNSLNKLGRAQMRVVLGQGTKYYLV